MSKKLTGRQIRRGDIVYGDDIIKNVAERLGISEEKVRHVYDFMFPYIRQLSKLPDVYSIRLGAIGRIYLMTEKMRHSLNSAAKKKMVSRRQRDNHKANVKKIEAFEETFQETKRTFAKNFVHTVHKKRSALSNYYYNKGLNHKELEESQNADQEIS